MSGGAGTGLGWPTRATLHLLGLYLVFAAPLGAAVTALPDHDLQRLLQIVLTTVAAAVVAWKVRVPVMTGARRRLALLCLLVLLGGASVAGAHFHGWAMREAALFLGCVTLAVFVASAVVSGCFPAIRGFIVISTAGYGLVVLAVVLAVLVTGSDLLRDALAFGYANYRFLNHVETVAVPLALHAALDKQAKRSLRIGARFAVAAHLCLILALGARGSSVGIALAFAIAAALFGRRISALVKPMLWATVQAIAGYLVLFVIAPDLNGNALDDNEYLGSRMSSVQARFYLWRLALQYIRAHPLLGVGPMHYAHFPNGEAAHPHNIYLQLAAEWGVPFAIVVSLAALWALWSLARAIKSAPVERSMDGVLPFIAVIAAAVDGFFSGNFVMPTSQVWIALAAGSALGWYWQQSAAISGLNQSVGRSTAGAIRCLLVAVLVSQVWLLHVTLSDLPGLHERLKQIEQRTGGTQSARFWSEGWF